MPVPESDLLRGAPVDAASPWPGPEAFRERDAAFFFGREQVRDALTHEILRHRLVVLYGRSGLGKTSLLRAGVFPRLRQALCLPVYLRLDFSGEYADAASGAAALRLQVAHAIEQAASEAHVDLPSLDPGATLWEWFYRTDAAFWNERSRRVQPVLVFDQFEEAFTIGGSSDARSARTAAFLDDLIHLIRGSVPPSVAVRFEAAPGEALAFTTGRDPCHLLLALRKEFLADLLRLRAQIPTMLEHHLELSGMSVADATLVVTGPGAHLVEPGVAERIVEFVAAARRTAADDSSDAMVDPAILSIFCQQLNLKRQAAQQPRITAALVAGTQDAIIADFYQSSVADLGADVQRFIEEELLTESGYRNSVALDEALRAPGVTWAAIGALIDRRLVRLEGSGPTGRLELTHDVLAEPIVENRNRRRLREEEERARQAQEAARLAREDAEERERRERELRQTRALLEKERENAELARQLADQGQREQAATVRLLETKRLALRRQQWLGALLALALIASVGLAAYALRARGSAERARRDAVRSLSLADLEQGRGLSAGGHSDRGLAYVARALRGDPDNAAARSRAVSALLYTTWPLPEADLPHDRPVLWAQFNASGDRIVTVSDDRTARVWNGRDGTPIGAPLRHDGRVFLARFNAAGRLLTVADDGIARLWDLSTGTVLQAYAHPESGVTWAAFNPVDGRIVTGAADGTVRFWVGGASTPLKAHAGSLTAASFNRAGDLLLTASADGTAAIWDVRSARPISRLAGHTDAVVSAQFSPDGRQVATASRDGSARLWDARTGRPLLPPLRHNAVVWSVQFNPDGSRLLTASDDGSALVWDTSTGRTIGNPMVHAAPVVSAFFSREGLRIITASRDQTARLWDAATGEPIGEPMRHDAAVESAVFSPDGQHAVTASDDGRARLWDVRTGTALPATLRLTGAPPLSAQFTPDGRQVAVITGGAEQGLLLWDANAPDAKPAARDRAAAVDFSADGALMLAVSGSAVTVWQRVTGSRIATLTQAGNVSSARFSPDGQLIVTAADDGTARTWEAATGRAVAAVRHGAALWNAAFSADGARIITASADGTARIWNALTGAPGPVFPHHPRQPGSPAPGAVFMASINRAGSRVLTAADDGTAKLWNAATGETVAVLPHENSVAGALFSPSGDMALTFSADRTARLWETNAGHAVATLTHDSPVDAADFSPDGRRVVTAAHDGALRLWDAEPGQPRPETFRHDAQVYSVRFAPGGDRIASAAADGTVRVWQVPVGTRDDAGALASLLERVAGYRVNEAGVAVQVPDRIDVIRRARRPQADRRAGDSLAARLEGWVFDDRASRTISPFSAVTIHDYIRRQLALGQADGIREARRLFGWDAQLEAQKY